MTEEEFDEHINKLVFSGTEKTEKSNVNNMIILMFFSK
jgi:hypothetical protein